MWFATHQGLGGHSVGHKHRERELLVVPGGRRRDKRERVHVCSDCGAEFATGVQLGGHKRKHWAGAPIVPKKKKKKKKPRAVVVVVLDQRRLPPPAGATCAAAPTLTLALAAQAVEPEPAVQRTLQPAARSPAVVGRVRIFGVDIGPVVQTPETRMARLRLRQRARGHRRSAVAITSSYSGKFYLNYKFRVFFLYII